MKSIMQSKQLRRRMNRNVGDLERGISATIGGALLIGGLARRNWVGVLIGAVGAALLQRGVTGHCNVYQQLDINTSRESRQKAGISEDEGTKVVESITINKRPEEVYDFWRDLSNLPTFMEHLSKVEVRDDKESHWEASGPAGQTLRWDARIIHDKPGEIIVWESLPGADVQSSGSVRFDPAPGARGTELKLSMVYRPPLGNIGVLGAKLFNQSLEKQLKGDLRRLRQLLETGELATAQTS